MASVAEFEMTFGYKTQDGKAWGPGKAVFQAEPKPSKVINNNSNNRNEWDSEMPGKSLLCKSVLLLNVIPGKS